MNDHESSHMLNFADLIDPVLLDQQSTSSTAYSDNTPGVEPRLKVDNQPFSTATSFIERYYREDDQTFAYNNVLPNMDPNSIQGRNWSMFPPDRARDQSFSPVHEPLYAADHQYEQRTSGQEPYYVANQVYHEHMLEIPHEQYMTPLMTNGPTSGGSNMLHYAGNTRLSPDNRHTTDTIQAHYYGQSHQNPSSATNGLGSISEDNNNITIDKHVHGVNYDVQFQRSGANGQTEMGSSHRFYDASYPTLAGNGRTYATCPRMVSAPHTGPSVSTFGLPWNTASSGSLRPSQQSTGFQSSSPTQSMSTTHTPNTATPGNAILHTDTMQGQGAPAAAAAAIPVVETPFSYSGQTYTVLPCPAWGTDIPPPTRTFNRTYHRCEPPYHWLITLARMYAIDQGLDLSKKYIFDKLPDNYVAMRTRRASVVQYDHYLYGLTQYRSPNAFYPHLKWMSRLTPPGWCKCKYCMRYWQSRDRKGQAAGRNEGD